MESIIVKEHFLKYILKLARKINSKKPFEISGDRVISFIFSNDGLDDIVYTNFKFLKSTPVELACMFSTKRKEYETVFSERNDISTT